MNKNILATSLLVMGSMFGGSCVAVDTSDGPATVTIENMTDTEYIRLQEYLYLGAALTTQRMLEADAISPDEVRIIIDILSFVVEQPVGDLGGGFLVDQLTAAGLTSLESQFVVTILEQEILTRGGATWLDVNTGEMFLSERTRQLLLTVADALELALPQ